MTLKITVQGEPEEIAAFFATVDKCECLSLVYQSDISKRASHHKWGSARCGVSVCMVTSAKPDVKIYERRPRRGEKKPVTKGWVYVMPAYDESGQVGYKIGKTVNPKSRKRTFSVKMPYSVNFVALLESDNYSQLEVDLHTEFRHKRTGGEFFNLNDGDIVSIMMRMTVSDIKKLSEVRAYYQA